jgi:hypothetical protein
MSVFAAQPAAMFAPPLYTRSPRTLNTPSQLSSPPAYHASRSQSSISIPSISKFSFSSFSFEPVKRIFTSTSTDSITTPAARPSTASIDQTGLSPVTTRSTDRTSISTSEFDELERSEALSPPPPTYSPIKIPTPSAQQPAGQQPPVYEPQEGRPQTGAGSRPALTTSPYSEYDAGYYASYLGEEWAGSRARAGGRKDGESVDGEKDDGCWCGSWWMMNGNPSMPWVAYYVF